MTEWATLNEAHARIVASGASSPLHALELDLMTGALPTGFLANGSERRKPVDETFWQRGILNARDGGVYVPVDLLPAWGEFFVERAALDARYPPVATMLVTPTVTAAKSEPPKRRRGPVTTHDWHTIDGEIAHRCIDKSGRLRLPKSENKLAKDMADWLIDEGYDPPAISELRAAVKGVLARLRRT
jgi:hypothetical protein